MSTGSMRSPAPPTGGNVVSVMKAPYGVRGPVPRQFAIEGSRARGLSASGLLNVEEANVFGVTGDETAPGFHVLAHQYAEQFIGRRRIVQGHQLQHTYRRIHGGFPELFGVHLAETFVALHAVFLVDLLAGRETRFQ